MSRVMSRAEAKAFKKRWRFLNAHEIRELARTPADVRLRQFFTLLGWARAFGWEEELSRGVATVRARWKRLRKAYRGQEARC
jgi:hypothetical protein